MSELVVLPDVTTPDAADERCGHPVQLGDSCVCERRGPDEGDVGRGQLGRSGAPNVLRSSNRLEVGRTDAIALRTEMVEIEPIRDRAHLLLVEGAVRQLVTSVEPDPGVAGALVGMAVPDPARRLVAAIDDRPLVGGEDGTSLQVADVPSDEPDRLSRDVTEPLVRRCRDRRRFTATALADPGRVRRRDRSALTTRPVAAYVRRMISSAQGATSPCRYGSDFAAAAFAEHRASLPVFPWGWSFCRR